MVSLRNHVDLEPESEDILLVWGLDPIKQNLDKVMLPTRSLAGKMGISRLEWKPEIGLELLE